MQDNKNIREKSLDIAILIIAILACVFSIYAVQDKILKIFFSLVFGLVSLVQIIRLFYTRQENTYNSNQKIQSICLINENNEVIREWDLFNKVALIIGRSSKNHEVDIDLSDCTYATLVEQEHAVLNFAAGEWYIEDLYSKNGIYIQKLEDNKKYMLSQDNPCKVEINDCIFIGKTKLRMK